MKHRITKTGQTTYDWFFKKLEKNFLTNPNGTRLNAIIARTYCKEAQAYILLQLYYLNDTAATQLKIELNYFDPLISDELYEYIDKKIGKYEF